MLVRKHRVLVDRTPVVWVSVAWVSAAWVSAAWVSAVWALVVCFGGVATWAADGGVEPKLRGVLQDEHAVGTDLWIYNDLQKAMAAARTENKPLFVTFRCVPCKACSGFDAEVAKGSERIARLAREKFVSVRQVEMKGVDLSLFQFDYDLNWAAMFVGPSGVVYARYGTQSAAGPDAYNSIAGLEKTMQRVLELHARYPEGAGDLAGKRGAEKPYRTPLEMPGLEEKEKRRGPTTRRNCIHCHNIHDAEQAQAKQEGAFREELLWRYPLPENAGLVMDAVEGTRVTSVTEDSPASRSGLRAGDVLALVGGQRVVSIADIQWVLHSLPKDNAALEIVTERGTKHTLRMDTEWKRTDISWRGSIWSLSPKLRVWTPMLEAAERKRHGIPDEQAALLVRWINTDSDGGRAARDAGLRQGDIVTAVEGTPLTMTPGQFNVHIKLHYKVGDELPLTVLRDGKRKAIRIRLAE